MKVLHICTNANGGAANSASRLHEGLIELGVNSKFLYLNGHNSGDQFYKYFYVPSSFEERIRTKLKLEHKIDVKNKRTIKNLQGDFELFSFPSTKYMLHRHALVQEADIINLHWVSNFLDYSSFFKEINKPIVWTIHDIIRS